MTRIYIPQPKSKLVNLWLDCLFDISIALANQAIISKDTILNLVTEDGKNLHYSLVPQTYCVDNKGKVRVGSVCKSRPNPDPIVRKVVSLPLDFSTMKQE